jgi:FkbM family methyltransferase
MLENLRLNGYRVDCANNLLLHSEVLESYPINVFKADMSELNSIGLPALGGDGGLLEPEVVQEVPATTLDAYCIQHGVRQIDFLKLDVEGAELNVFRGSRGLLAEGRIRCILFEISKPMIEGVGENPEEVFDILHEYNYKIYQFEGERGLKGISKFPGNFKENFLAFAENTDFDREML